MLGLVAGVVAVLASRPVAELRMGDVRRPTVNPVYEHRVELGDVRSRLAGRCRDALLNMGCRLGQVQMHHLVNDGVEHLLVVEPGDDFDGPLASGRLSGCGLASDAILPRKYSNDTNCDLRNVACEPGLMLLHNARYCVSHRSQFLRADLCGLPRDRPIGL